MAPAVVVPASAAPPLRDGPPPASQWETVLAALAGQLRAGRHTWDRHRIRDALNEVLHALGEDPLPDRRRVHQPPEYADPPEDATAAAAGTLIVAFGGQTTDATLTRLADYTGHPTAVVRDALAHLASRNLAVLYRHGQPVDDVAALAEHARFQLRLPRP
ncbi:hypothetical protein ACFY2R_20855 [Micromonospora olivasterospora]|uniref:Uncharacterized protein n=1 Tax=Micromonospora olivasterospora TaxID=1880 RepID=A0A562IEM1_MICOL|nr:hypothetical protein [Micromonospora olivasterospora]TWH69479.1 hypothetical protein JD77_04489 [Micromonospora olivasterospora]